MGLDNLTALDVPAHLLATAYLVGKIPVRACQSDPRTSYTLYIPEDHYKGVHQLLVKDPQCTSPEAKLPLVVNVHGSRRDAILCRNSLMEFADTHGVAVLAPLFPAALDDLGDINNYHNLRSKTLKADVTFLDMLAEVARLWPGIDCEKVFLIGFSGGGQFSHRFLYLYPERLRAAVIGSPGATTWLGTDEKWPAGVADVGNIFEGRQVDMDKVRQLGPIMMAVGGNDNEVSKRSELRKLLAAKAHDRSAVDRVVVTTPQNRRPGRVFALEDLQKNWLSVGIDCELTIVPGVAHEYPKTIPIMAAMLAKQIEQYRKNQA